MAKDCDWSGRKRTGVAAEFLAEDGGATAIEYALIAGLLSLAIVAVVPEIGTVVVAFFNTLKGSF